MAGCDDARHGRELVGSPLWQRLYLQWHEKTKYTARIHVFVRGWCGLAGWKQVSK